MFRFFSNNSIKSWELELLKQTLNQLPKEYHRLIEQIQSGLLKRVIGNSSDKSGNVSFSFNPNVYSRFCKENEVGYILGGIQVYDKKISDFIDFQIHVSSGVITGYSLGRPRNKVDIDLLNIKLNRFEQITSTNDDFFKLQDILNEDELLWVNPVDVMFVSLDGADYYTIKVLEDGDYLAIDKRKNIYELSHEDHNATPLGMGIHEYFNRT